MPAHRFFPKSAELESWKIYATASPNLWIIIYKGYYFHLSNRIGSYYEHHLDSIRERIKDIESIEFPSNHFIRVRSAYHDDKNGNYIWQLDYMYPNDESPVLSTAQIAHTLGDGYALEDGQSYTFDVIHRSYFQHSDHYDPDHYEYYASLQHSSQYGFERELDRKGISEKFQSETRLREELEKNRHATFQKLCKKLEEVKSIKMLGSCNSGIEDLDKFHLKRNWSKIIEDNEIDSDRFFSAWFFFSTNDQNAIHKLVGFLPQTVDQHFRLTRPCIYLPSLEQENRSVRDSSDDEVLFELTLSIHPSAIGNMITGRSLLNDYFLKFIDGIDAYNNNQPDTSDNIG